MPCLWPVYGETTPAWGSHHTSARPGGSPSCGSARCREVCPEGLDAYDLMRLAKVRANVLAEKKPPASDYHLIDLSRRAQLGPDPGRSQGGPTA